MKVFKYGLLQDVFRTEKELQLAMELLKGGELFDALIENGPYTEQDAANHIKAISAALHYLHTSHVVHRYLPCVALIACLDVSVNVGI